MFERSLIASQGTAVSVQQRWTTIVSITVQAALAGVIISLPLLHPQVIHLKVEPLRAFIPAPKLQEIKLVPVQRSAANAAPTSVPMPTQSVPFTAPRVIPATIKMGGDNPPPQTFSGTGMGMGSLPDSLATIGSGSAPTVTVAPEPRPKRLNVSSGVSAGMLMSPIRPVYPQIAKVAHVQGAVVVEAIISKSGTIESLHVVSGPDMLRASALAAIREARYQPYRLNGEPTEVQTTFTVNFVLGG